MRRRRNRRYNRVGKRSRGRRMSGGGRIGNRM